MPTKIPGFAHYHYLGVELLPVVRSQAKSGVGAGAEGEALFGSGLGPNGVQEVERST